MLEHLRAKPHLVGKILSMLATGYFEKAEKDATKEGSRELPRSYTKMSQLSCRIISMILSALEPEHLNAVLLGQLPFAERARLLYYSLACGPQSRLPAGVRTEQRLIDACAAQYLAQGSRLKGIDLDDAGLVGWDTEVGYYIWDGHQAQVTHRFLQRTVAAPPADYEEDPEGWSIQNNWDEQEAVLTNPRAGMAFKLWAIFVNAHVLPALPPPSKLLAPGSVGV